MERWAGIVLAAGQGVRMKSRLPKALHKVCGKELIRYPVDLLRQVGVRHIVVVVSPGNAAAIQGLLGDSVDYVTQPAVLGTGDAVERARERLAGQVEQVLVQNADAPLVQPESVSRLMEVHHSGRHDMTLLSTIEPALKDFGRVLRDEQGNVIDIIEASDWKKAEEPAPEVNGGVYCFRSDWLWDNLPCIESSAKGERYLTALAGIAVRREASVQAVVTSDSTEVLGINNRLQLAQVEVIQRGRIREHWMLAGVTIQDPATTYIDADVTIGQDTVIRPNTILQGRSSIGEECEIGPGSLVRDSRIGHRCRITASVLEESTMEEDSNIGPFSHLRPGTHIESHVHIGNFAEINRSRVGAGSAMGHLGYVGDAVVGANVNLGAGLVTCNYDGKVKHQTVIEDGAFIGCDTMLIAPVKIGEKSVTGAGSVVTKDVPSGKLAVGVPARVRDRNTKPE